MARSSQRNGINSSLRVTWSMRKQNRCSRFVVGFCRIANTHVDLFSRRDRQVFELREVDRPTGSSSIDELPAGRLPTTQPEQRLSKHSAVRCEYWQQPPAAIAMAKAAALTLPGISSIPTRVVVTERQPKTESAAYCLSKTIFNVMGFPSASTPDDVWVMVLPSPEITMRPLA